MNRFEMFKNLMMMAAADRNFTEEEVQLLSLRASRLGVTDRQFDEAIRLATSGEMQLSIPDTRDEQLKLLRELIEVMAADGELAPEEKQLFASAAARMEITEDELNDLIDQML
jgi:uncharacterized tellurite resistance protein B-like protein